MTTTLRLCAKRIGVATLFAFAALLAAPRIAHADEAKDCEPGSWFCAEDETEGELEPLPAASPAEAKPAEKTPPPVVVYQPAPPTVVVQPREAPPAYRYTPLKPPRKREWGLNLHLAGAMIGAGRDGNASMGVAGLGLRFRPIPHAGIEADLDFAGGRDYNGFRRRETGFALNGLLFLNPKSVAQVYLLAGFGWSGARAIDDRAGYDTMEYRYGYFGVQSGVGIEFRLSKVVALNIDLRGLLRGRVDDSRHQYPEFVSDDGRSTNASGAGMFRTGLTFYW